MATAAQQWLHFALFVLNVARAMGLVTFKTLCIGHGLSMPCMAVETAVGVAVFCVALCAVHVRMHTRMLLHLLARSCMTGETYRLHRRDRIQLHLHGCMRVVTLSALPHTVMGRSFRRVTLGT